MTRHAALLLVYYNHLNTTRNIRYKQNKTVSSKLSFKESYFFYIYIFLNCLQLFQNTAVIQSHRKYKTKTDCQKLNKQTNNKSEAWPESGDLISVLIFNHCSSPQDGCFALSSQAGHCPHPAAVQEWLWFDPWSSRVTNHSPSRPKVAHQRGHLIWGSLRIIRSLFYSWPRKSKEMWGLGKSKQHQLIERFFFIFLSATVMRRLTLL